MTRELPPPFTMSEAARTHLQTALAHTPGKTGIRIGIKTAGCSGLKYEFALREAPDPADRVFRVDGVTVYVAPMAEIHLTGARLDLVRKGLNTELDFTSNPNEAARCGCGESFMPIPGKPAP